MKDKDTGGKIGEIEGTLRIERGTLTAISLCHIGSLTIGPVEAA